MACCSKYSGYLVLAQLSNVRSISAEQLFTQNELESLLIAEMNCPMASACLEPKLLILRSIALTLQTFPSSLRGRGREVWGQFSLSARHSGEQHRDSAKLVDGHMLAMGKSS